MIDSEEVATVIERPAHGLHLPNWKVDVNIDRTPNTQLLSPYEIWSTGS